MVKTSIEKLASEIGYDIGMSDDVVQSNLINGFSRALVSSMQDHILDTQVCYIVDKLDINSIVLIKKLYSFVELREKK